MPRTTTKYRDIAGVIEARIRRGDYVITGLQSDRAIAAEFAVSRLTARQALRLLIAQGHVLRKGNGRLELPGAEGVPAATRQIAFLAPSFPSPFLQRLRVAAERAATGLGFRFRPVDYLHWTDQVVHETLALFDGVMLVPPGGMAADAIMQRAGAARAGILSIGRDLAGQGRPSLLVNPPEGVQTLCDHLAGLGHRRIDCLNVHAPSTGLPLRLQQWRVWRAAHGLEGELHDHALAPFADPMQGGYDAMRAALAAGRFAATALICTTELNAIGACRALREAGRVVGRDVAVCTFGGDGFCRFHTPSLTCLEHADPAPYLRLWCEWVERGRTGWVGPLALQLQDRLFHGESTAPPGGWPAGQERIAGPVPGPVPPAAEAAPGERQ